MGKKKVALSGTTDTTITFSPEVLDSCPKDWITARLEEHLELMCNGLNKVQNKEGRGLPVTRIETISSDRINPEKVGYVEDVTQRDLEKFRLHKGDILFSHINSEPQIGRSVIYEGTPETLLHGMNLLCIRAKVSLDTYFLNYLFAYYRSIGFFVGISARAVNQNSINQGKMKAVVIPLPPLPEQRAIAYVLRTVQRAKEATEKVIAAARILKQSLMRHLFTYGLVSFNETNNISLREAEGGFIPSHWNLARLGTIAKLSTGTTPSTKCPEYYCGTIPFIKTTGIANNIIRSTQSFISQKAVDAYNLKLYPAGTVFMAMYGQGKTRGQVSLLELPATTTQNTAAIVPSEKIDSLFLWLLLMSQYELLRGKGFHGQISHLNLGYVKELEIAVPPPDEQVQISTMLSVIQSKLETEEKRLESLETLFRSLLHNLMTGKVRVHDLELLIPEEAIT